MPDDRPDSQPDSQRDSQAIEFHRDAQGNAIVQGEGNVVIIHYHAAAVSPPGLEPKESRSEELGANPYKGLSFFREEDAQRFFGREELTRDLWQHFRDLHVVTPGQPAPLRILPLIGPSGSGKSSLARAGLLPELARHAMPGLRKLRVGVFTPGKYPLEALAAMLARVATGDPSPVAKAREFMSELRLQDADGAFSGLRRIASSLPEITESPLVLLIDQFEEAFSSNDHQEIVRFVGNIMHAVSEVGSPVSVILTLRSDFLGATMRYPDLNAAISTNGRIIPAMKPEELRMAIAKPAEQAGHPLDGAVIDLLLDQTSGQENVLPLLQFTLHRIWEGLARGIPANTTIDELGGVGGALATGASETFGRLSDADKIIAKRAFLAMVNLGEGARDTRRRARVSELLSEGEDQEHLHEILQIFAEPETRLISLAADQDGEITMELTHEALLDYWGDLREWVEKHREDIRFQRQLDDTVKRWEENDRAEGSLWRPPDLDVLRNFYRKSDLKLNELQLQFLQASEARQRRASLNRKIVYGGIAALLLVIAIGGVGFGFYANELRQTAVEARNVAERESKISQSREILALASGSRDENAECSLILAAKAYETLKGTEGVELWTYVDALRKSLAVSHLVYTHQASGDLVISAAFLEDGKSVAYVAVDGQVRILDPEKPGAEKALPVTDALAIGRESVQGNLAVGDLNGRIEVWQRGDDGNWRKDRAAKVDQFPIQTLVQSPDGKRYLALSEETGSGRQRYRSFSVDADSLESTPLIGGSGFGRTATWSPDSRYAAIVDAYRTLAVIDVQENKEAFRFEGHPSNIHSVSWNPQGNWIAVGLDDGAIWIWDVQEQRRVSTLSGHSNQVTDLDWNSDGTVLASASWDSRIMLWSAGGWGHLATLTGHTSGIVSLDWEAKGSRLVSASQDSTVRIWESQQPRSPRVLHAVKEWMWDVAWSADGRYLAVASDDGLIKLWDQESGTDRTLEGDGSPVTRLAWSPDSKGLASVTIRGNLIVWDAERGEPLFAQSAHSASAYGVSWSGDGTIIATSSLAESNIRFWNADSGEYEGGVRDVASPAIAFAPKGAVLAIASIGFKRVTLVDAKERRPLEVQMLGLNPAASSWDIEWSPDGGRIAVASDDNVVRIWNTASGTLLSVLKGHTSDVKGVAWSADGLQLATASLDTTVRIWNAGSGRTRAILPGHTKGARSVDWSNDGRTVVSAGEDGTLLLSMVNAADIIETGNRQIDIGLTKKERSDCIGGLDQ